MDLTKLSDFFATWLQDGGEYIKHNLVPALVTLFLGILVIRLLIRLVNKLLAGSKLEKAAHTLIKTVVRAALFILLGLTVASKLSIDVTGVIALASVLTLAISLSVQNALTNLISGFTLLYTKPFSSGDYVEVGGQSGSVHEIGLTYTKLITPDNKYVYIPNGAVTAAEIVNYTVRGTRRLDVNVAVGYDNAMEDVMAALKEAGDLPAVLPEQGVFVALTSYGDNAINYVLRVWTTTDDYWPTNFAIHERINTIFARRGITMTYPHLNVHLDK